MQNPINKVKLLPANCYGGNKPIPVEALSHLWLTIHHAVTTSNATTWRVLKNRELSSTFCIEDNEIWQTAPFNARQYTNGSFSLDKNALTIETANQSISPPYPISQASKWSIAKVAVWLEQQYKGFKCDLRHINFHKDIQATKPYCPNDISKGDIISKCNTIKGLSAVKEKHMAITIIDEAKGYQFFLNQNGLHHIKSPEHLRILRSKPRALGYDTKTVYKWNSREVYCVAQTLGNQNVLEMYNKKQ